MQLEQNVTTAPINEDEVEIRIRDTGYGMTDDVKRKMFDPFFTTKPVGEGTGLGLSISHGILERHRATFDVDSRPGEGTEITIRLPVAQPMPADETPEPAEPRLVR